MNDFVAIDKGFRLELRNGHSERFVELWSGEQTAETAMGIYTYYMGCHPGEGYLAPCQVH